MASLLTNHPEKKKSELVGQSTFSESGNSLVLYVAIRNKKFRNVTNCYITNLAITDLLFLLLSIPLTTYLGFRDTWPFGQFLCKIYIYLAHVILQATCFTLAVMSIDRYLYIVQVKAKLKWRTVRNAFIICLLIWTASLLFIIPFDKLARASVQRTSKHCGVDSEQSVISCLITLCSYYAIPLAIIIICYSKLLLYVIENSKSMAETQTAAFRQVVRTKQKRVTRMVVVVTLAFAICWLPIQTLELLKCTRSPLLLVFIHYPKLLNRIRIISHALAYFNSCLNPCLYALLNRNFCADVVRLIPTSCQCTKSVSTTSWKQHKLRNVILSPGHEQHESSKNDNETIGEELINLKDLPSASCHIEQPNDTERDVDVNNYLLNKIKLSNNN
ncbi:unnamed protein product [Didymodactylos carnosus]|uniref:G-protein coupled receptors family 1 profile domain-containing protein n=1 Tax=Didymodactylos carnosus TaxID=1234261 RepID=A0A814EIF7_9BILA|nr:unnamed protein product [Didymodactylos carnosus]CAF3742715.1 unnamed protein product [Didymodactylos carnosus]